MMRQLSFLDIPQILQIEHECFPDPWTENMFQDEFTYGAHYIGAFDGDLLLGYAGISIVLDEAELRNVAVRPKARRRGIAQTLITKLLERDVISIAHLEVRESNLAAINLYKHLGFEQVGCRKKYYSNPPEAAILMSKRINRANIIN